VDFLFLKTVWINETKRGINMECKEIQKQIEDFDFSRLTLKDNEEFLRHLETCKDCREELEIYYIVKYGLTDDKIIPNQVFGYDDKEVKDEMSHLFDRLDFEGVVNYRIKIEKEKIDKIKRLIKYSKYSLLATDAIMILTIIALAVI
jgi:hypothetical protein